MNGERGTFAMVHLSVLLALAVALHAVEALIPVPYLFPGAKLGLANIVALHVIYTYGAGAALAVTGLRALLGSIMSGTFLGTGFALSVSGGLSSTAVMGLLGRSARGPGRDSLSPVGVSVAGAVTHNVTQLAVASLLTRQAGLVFYLPVLLFFAVPTGVFVGVLSQKMKPLEGTVRALLKSRSGRIPDRRKD
ncbi:MAG: Gx transporter family protein [Firmicutes bacterium]|nr:Gx transporter family protein [Bacillota bacterium]